MTEDTYLLMQGICQKCRRYLREIKLQIDQKPLYVIINHIEKFCEKCKYIVYRWVIRWLQTQIDKTKDAEITEMLITIINNMKYLPIEHRASIFEEILGLIRRMTEPEHKARILINIASILECLEETERRNMLDKIEEVIESRYIAELDSPILIELLKTYFRVDLKVTRKILKEIILEEIDEYSLLTDIGEELANINLDRALLLARMDIPRFELFFSGIIQFVSKSDSIDIGEKWRKLVQIWNFVIRKYPDIDPFDHYSEEAEIIREYLFDGFKTVVVKLEKRNLEELKQFLLSCVETLSKITPLKTFPEYLELFFDHVITPINYKTASNIVNVALDNLIKKIRGQYQSTVLYQVISYLIEKQGDFKRASDILRKINLSDLGLWGLLFILLSTDLPPDSSLDTESVRLFLMIIRDMIQGLKPSVRENLMLILARIYSIIDPSETIGIIKKLKVKKEGLQILYRLLEEYTKKNDKESTKKIIMGILKILPEFKFKKLVEIYIFKLAKFLRKMKIEDILEIVNSIENTNTRDVFIKLLSLIRWDLDSWTALEIIEKISDPKIKIEVMCYVANKYFKTNPIGAERILNKALSLIETISDIDEKDKALSEVAKQFIRIDPEKTLKLTEIIQSKRYRWSVIRSIMRSPRKKDRNRIKTLILRILDLVNRKDGIAGLRKFVMEFRDIILDTQLVDTLWKSRKIPNETLSYVVLNLFKKMLGRQTQI